MPSVIHGGDEFTNLLEAPSTTGKWRHTSPIWHFTTQDYCRSAEGEGWGSGVLPLEKLFRATPSRTAEKAPWEHCMKAAITIDTCSQSKNLSFNLKPKYKEVTMTLAFTVV